LSENNTLKMTSVAFARRVITASRRACLKGSGKRELSALVAADYEFPDLPSLSPEPAKATSISVSTLSNGLTIVSEDASNTSTVTLTFPKAGSSNEMVEEQGAALANKCMNFRSGSGMSSILINRTIEDEGGFPYTSVDRTKATLGYTVTPDKAIGLIPLLATECTFEKWDVRDAKNLATVETKAAFESAQIVLTENLFAAAYGAQSPAGRPIFFSETPLDAVIAFRQ
jgi:predicted Zn-dependent peptidase